jgi:hypothetical protein
MQIKPGVSLVNVSWRMFHAALVAEEIYARQGSECIITSAGEGKHMRSSKHYARNNPSRMIEAIDIRRRNITDPARACREIQAKLGRDYDCVLERDHLHIEWDQK